MLTRQDEENYGSDFIDFSKRAAIDAVRPELQRLHAENQNLRAFAQRAQNSTIQQALDQAIPNWRAVYADPAFAEWLSSPDPYAGETRSQLMRGAVAAGDASRVVRFYQGFQRDDHAPAGQRGQRPHQSRPAATGGRPIYSREQIKQLYEQRRLGHISDAKWGPLEADIFAAGREGRVAGALSLVDGTELSRLR
jgi:hypothetical protein